MEKTLTLAEKDFICRNRPIVEIERLDFTSFHGMNGDGKTPDMAVGFISQYVDRTKIDEDYELIFASFHFVDRGIDLQQKTVEFRGFSQFFDNDGDIDIYFDEPDWEFQAVADKDGRFCVSVPMFVRSLSEGTPCTLDILKSHSDSVFQFNSVVVSNPYVSENLDLVLGSFDDEKCTVENILYRLKEEQAEEENPEE